MINQLKQDFIDLFADTERIQEELDESYNGEYADMIVKEIYDIYPKVHYPMITIQELSNESVDRFWDGDKDNVVYLGYQIVINATQSETLTAIKNVQKIASILDSYLKQDKYKCLRRIGSLAIIPLISDNNVMTGTLRYECYLNLNDNTIYRRN